MPELSLPTAQPSSAHSVSKKRKTDGRRWQQSRTYQCLPAPRFLRRRQTRDHDDDFLASY